MGTRYTFACPECAYSAEVSGGLDYGMVAVVRTMTCADCAGLVDVLTGRQGREGPTGDRRYDRDLGRCPDCRGRHLQAWTHPGPCPKCGAAMERDRDAFELQWD